MNKTNLFVMLAAMLISFASCTMRELVDYPAEKGYYTVNFSMDDPSKVQSRAYDHLEGNINQLYAVVFDATGITDVANLTGNEALEGVYMVDVKKDGDTYDCMFRMDQSGEFAVCFVANPNTALVDAIKGAADITAFKALVAAQNPETFLMVSQEFHLFELTDMAQEVELDASNADSSTEVLMKRTVARIDIKNYVDDLQITSITFKNRSIQSLLWNDNSNSTADGYLEETKTYTTSIAGNSTEPGLYEAEIYTYEQLNSTGKVPSLEFGYTLGTTNYNVNLGLEFKKEGNYVTLKRNFKYTVNIRMGDNKIRFTIDVLDWETGETFTLTPEALADKETENRPDQQTLNQALKAYSLFVEDEAAAFNVASIDNDGTVTFETELRNNPNAANKGAENTDGAYYTYTEAMALTGLNVNGQNYRLPTAGELNLLLPTYSLTGTVAKHPWWNDNVETNTAGNAILTDEYKETVYLENLPADASGHIYWDTTKSFAGWSKMKLGADDQETTVLYSTKNYDVRPVYAYRFKGTDQYAAYRWESCKLDPSGEETERYFSIKIKALDNYHDADITVEQIADEDFWADGYIEVKFPASGYYSTAGNLTNRGVNGYCWSSSRNSATNARYLLFNLGNASVGGYNVGNKFPLRLVPQE